MKKLIRLTEQGHHKIMKESAKRILREDKFVNNKRLDFSNPLYDKKGFGRSRRRWENNFSQEDQVELVPYSEMDSYDVKFRKDLVRLKKALREKYGVNPNSIHTRITGDEYTNPHEDVSIVIPRNEASKINGGKEFGELTKQLHFVDAPQGNADNERQLWGTICLMYDNPDNDDFEDGYSEHGIRINNSGKAYQPTNNEPEGSDAFWNEFYLNDEF